MKTNVRILLSAMMFLQFFVWGSWFATLGAVLTDNGLAQYGGSAYGSAPIAAIIAPLFLGLVADRFFNSEKAMGVLHLIGGGIMFLAPGLVASGNGDVLVWVLIGHTLCYMPTLGLSNTIAFANIDDQNKFPSLRVWGTIGWIAAGLVVGGLGWSRSTNIFNLAAISALVLGFFCFFLPATPPPAKGKPVNLKALLMVDAFKMLVNIPFLVFIISSTLICIPFAYYFLQTPNFLIHIGFGAAASTMTLGQMLEIPFMLLIPILYRRLGVKWLIVIAMSTLAMRFALFSLGAPDQVIWMILLGVIVHGICYDFFFVTGFMYTANKAGREIRGQAQAMLVFFTQGIGFFIGYQVAGTNAGTTVTNMDSLSDAIPQTQFTYWESLGKMFSADKPEIPGTLFADTMMQWKDFWMVPCLLAAGIAIIFLLSFWEKKSCPKQTSKEESSSFNKSE